MSLSFVVFLNKMDFEGCFGENEVQKSFLYFTYLLIALHEVKSNHEPYFQSPCSSNEIF